MQTRLKEFHNEEQYITKSVGNYAIKLTCESPETYRKLARYIRESTTRYQPKEERSYRMVIKYLHHSVVTQELKDELSQHGYKVIYLTPKIVSPKIL